MAGRSCAPAFGVASDGREVRSSERRRALTTPQGKKDYAQLTDAAANAEPEVGKTLTEAGAVRRTRNTRNPTKGEIEQEIRILSGQFEVPFRALIAVISAESDYRQFDTQGNPLISPQSDSSAAGLGQVTRTAANLYEESYERLLTDWKYNLFVSTKIYAAGYHHPWNREVGDLRIRAARAYGMYHDGFEPDFDRDLYRRKPRGLVNSEWIDPYLTRY